jgi:hypothetical protein
MKNIICRMTLKYSQPQSEDMSRQRRRRYGVRHAACGKRREAARGAALPPSWLLLTAGGGQGRKRRIAIFCDKLTNLGWLTLSVLKYLMKTEKFIRESA